jgi:hypothetical protein
MGKRRTRYDTKPSRPAREVREPVQVYLDQKDRELLEQVAKTKGWSRAEVLRRGLRSLAAEALTERPPGWSLDYLIGCLGDDPSIPTDLAERHDYYLVEALEEHARRHRVD